MIRTGFIFAMALFCTLAFLVQLPLLTALYYTLLGVAGYALTAFLPRAK